MQSKAIRQAFLDYFERQQHMIVPSAPIVVKDDPTLMFTNAGMNPFKDIFLGNKKAQAPRVADTQKCLRVSGKHNDLEEVGVDTYHHTMFEMLGNWSFGDYFKEEAINWAWDLLTNVYGISKDRLYASVFGGDEEDGLPVDAEAEKLWKNHLPDDRILRFDKKDNFWEMGDTGPCGPCSEIHVDMRPDAERAKGDGASLVNMDHPQVIEIWNLVFIQFNRKADKSLVNLPSRHVDTGMGFERLCMVLQNKSGTYDTDIFTPLISFVEQRSGKKYNDGNKQIDIAIRVIVDHIRAVSFAIADGQLPSNSGAGYVIRRILRRAVRYGYSSLEIDEPFMSALFPVLADSMGSAFPELDLQRELICKVIQEEEVSFRRTLASGLKRIDQIEEKLNASGETLIDGSTTFELYDTYGFPFDLTQLVAAEKGLKAIEEDFKVEMEKQKKRSRSAAQTDASEWQIVSASDQMKFVGYDSLTSEAKVVMYRTAQQKKKKVFQLVLDQTPFYAESGGQVGDTGQLHFGEEVIHVLDTKKENELIVHFINKLPENLEAEIMAVVNCDARVKTAANHSATHILHAALKEVLGDHVQQKGSYVGPDRLRFDFSHFSKVTDEELQKVESISNMRIRSNIAKDEQRDVPVKKAMEMGATALFGEKYGDKVRMITFDPDFSRELCGGTHVEATGQIGMLKIVMETSVAAGIRRIEALSGEAAEEWMREQLNTLAEAKELLKSPNLVKGILKMQEDQQTMQRNLETLGKAQLGRVRDELKASAILQDEILWIVKQVEVPDADGLKQISFDLRNELGMAVIILGAEIEGKALLSVMLADELVSGRGWNAGQVVREAAKEIKGGGGGQPFYATAGGKNPAGIQSAIEKAADLLKAEKVN